MEAVSESVYVPLNESEEVGMDQGGTLNWWFVLFWLFFFQVEERTRYFSVFYLSINAGSLISTFVTPMLRGWDLFWGPLHKLYSGQPEICSRLLTVHLLLLYKFLILICLAQKKDYWIRCWEERRWLCLWPQKPELIEQNIKNLRFRINLVLFFPVGDVQCFGKDCYALAFGVPGVLMLIALGKCSGARKLITTDAFHMESMM